VEILDLPLGAVVGVGGYTNDFITLPAVSEWSTRSAGTSGGFGSAAIASAAVLDAYVQSNDLSLTFSALASSTVSPPSAAATAVWCSAGYVQTRPTQNACTLMMATLVNNSGLQATNLALAYEYATNRATAVTEEVRGLRVYYSLTGASNSWVLVPGLSQTTQGILSTNVLLAGIWSNRTAMYLLWADANGSGAPDDANDIDSFSVAVAGGIPLAAGCALAAPADGQSFGAPAEVSLVASASAGPGGTLAGVGFYTVREGQLGSVQAAPFVVNAIFDAGTYLLYAVATNSEGETFYSRTNAITVTNVPFSVALTKPVAGAAYGAPAMVSLAASAQAGSGSVLLGLGFYDAAGGWLASALSAPYTNAASLAAGTHYLYAVATNNQGLVCYSGTNAITVTNVPLQVVLTNPVNGATYGYPGTLTCAATVQSGSSGQGIRSAAFYQITGGSAACLGSVAVSPYTWPVAGLAEGPHGFFAVVTNLGGEVAYSGTNWITVSALIAGTVSREPYLGSRGETNIAIRWRTAETTVGRVRFGTNSASLDRYADDGASRTDHVVALTGLAPDTRYYYCIGTPNGVLKQSASYYFTTAPRIGTARSTRIWFLSDFGQKGDATQVAVRNAYQSLTATEGKEADLWLTGGDNEQSGLAGADSDYQTSVFNVYSNLLPNLPVFPTPGNHDGGAASAYWNIFDVPTQGQAGGSASGNAHYYSYDYGNIHFISLDAFNTATDSSSAMLAWMTNDLAATKQRWIVAYWHAPVYCKVFYDSDSLAQSVAMRQNFVPVLEKYGVDLVLNGHSHVLQRSFFVNRHYGIASTFSETNKVVAGSGRIDDTGAYIKTGTAGAVYVVAPTGCGMTRSGSLHAACYTMVNSAAGSIVVDVNGDRLDFRMVSSTGTIADYFTILKQGGQSVSRPYLTGKPLVSQGVFTVGFAGTPGLVYTVQRTDNLQSGWVNWTNITAPVSSIILLQDPVGTAPRRLYRLVYPAQ
jgi:predicted MPP superfamily phosphohydrolase